MCQALMCCSFTISARSLYSSQVVELADLCAGIHGTVPARAKQRGSVTATEPSPCTLLPRQ